MNVMTTKNGEMEELFNGALESRIEKQTEIVPETNKKRTTQKKRS